MLSALFRRRVCVAVLWCLVGCLWLLFVVSFLIGFKSLCWEGVEDRLQVCVGFFVLFIQVLAGLLSLCSLDASVQDLPEFPLLGFEAHLRCVGPCPIL